MVELTGNEIRGKRVGLLGGSFNPPHLGHVEICQYLFDRDECDQIWVMPCYEHPFGKHLAPFEDRLAMCRLTFQVFGDKVWVTDVERHLGGVSVTIRTIQYLKRHYYDRKFALITGSDVTEEKGQWKDFKVIEDLVDIIEIPRGADSPIMDISSTEIRRRIMNGESFDQYVAKPVGAYIVTHGLYHG